MPIGEEPTTGENDDRVRVRIGTDDLFIVERYSFHASIFQQPSAFSVTISGGRATKEILARYRPGTTCSLYIGLYRQFTGEIDAVNPSGDASRTTIDFTGRDLMARIHDQNIEAEFSIQNASYDDIVKLALADTALGHKIIEVTNDANREIKSGARVKVTKQPVKKGETRQLITTVASKLGETWLQFLDRHFRKLGLFLWSDAEGNFVLSRPNVDQEAAFHFYRTNQNGRRVCNVKKWALTNDTTGRFVDCAVFARNGGRKKGVNHTHGEFRDEEMGATLRYARRRVYRDTNVVSEEEAAYYSRRRIAEVNRAGWKLQYTVSGHSAPTPISTVERAIPCFDMIAHVDDDDLDIHDDLYITDVEHRSPNRESVITLMRKQDILFGEWQPAVEKAKAAVAKRRRAETENTRVDIEGMRLGDLPMGLDFKTLGVKDLELGTKGDT